MADSDDVFVYLGGDQRVPEGATHAVIPSINFVRGLAFYYRRQLASVIFHDGVELIEGEAFSDCYFLRGMKLLNVKDIRYRAFLSCFALSDVEFGDRLQRIGMCAFYRCSSLR